MGTQSQYQVGVVLTADARSLVTETGRGAGAIAQLGQNAQASANTANAAFADIGRHAQSSLDIQSAGLRKVTAEAQAAEQSLGSMARQLAGMAAGAFALTKVVEAITSLPKAGIEFAAATEVSRLGMAGILTSMTRIDGHATSMSEALGIAGQYISKLNDDALRTAASSQELIGTFQALIGPGLAAKMSLEQIRELTVTGVNAVKSLGLANNQVVQELRDLVQGGITPASSTLATALGITDADIKRIKADGSDLFAFLMDRMRGFEQASNLFGDTLTGRMDALKEGATRVAADGFAPLTAAMKTWVSDAAGAFVVVEKHTDTVNGKLRELSTTRLNSDTITSLQAIASGMVELGNAAGVATHFVYEHRAAVLAVAEGYVAYKVAVGSVNLASNIASWAASKAAIVENAIALEQQRLADAEAAAGALRRAEAERVVTLAQLERARAQTVAAQSSLVQSEADARQLALQAALAAGAVRQIEESGALAAATARLAAAEQALTAATTEQLAAQAARGSSTLKTTATLEALTAAETRLAAAESAVSLAQAAVVAELARLDAARSAALAMNNALAESELRQAAAAEAASVAESGRAVAMGRATVAAEAAAVANGQLAAAETAAAVATRAGAVATGVARGALALLGGPIGAITLALGAGVIAWQMFGNAARTDADKAVDATGDVIAETEKLIAKLEQRNRLLGKNPEVEGQRTKLQDAILAQSQHVTDLEQRAQAAAQAGQAGMAQSWAIAAGEARKRLEEQAAAMQRLVDKADKPIQATGQSITNRFDSGQFAQLVDEFLPKIDKLNKKLGELKKAKEDALNAAGNDPAQRAKIEKEAALAEKGMRDRYKQSGAAAHDAYHAQLEAQSNAFQAAQAAFDESQKHIEETLKRGEVTYREYYDGLRAAAANAYVAERDAIVQQLAIAEKAGKQKDVEKYRGDLAKLQAKFKGMVDGWEDEYATKVQSVTDKVSGLLASAEVEALKSQGRLIEAARLQMQQELEKFDKEAKKLGSPTTAADRARFVGFHEAQIDKATVQQWSQQAEAALNAYEDRLKDLRARNPGGVFGDVAAARSAIDLQAEYAAGVLKKFAEARQYAIEHGDQAAADALDHKIAEAKRKLQGIPDEVRALKGDIANGLSQALEDGFARGASEGGKAFLKSLENQLKSAVFRVAVQAIVQPVSGAIANALSGAGGGGLGAGGGGIGSLGQIGSMFNTASGWFASAPAAGMNFTLASAPGMAGFYTPAASVFAAPSVGATLTTGTADLIAGASASSTVGASLTTSTVDLIAADAAAGATAGAAAGASTVTAGISSALSTIASAMPYVAIALFAAQALGLFKHGGPKSGGQAMVTDKGVEIQDTTPGRLFFTPNQGDAGVAAIEHGVSKSVAAALLNLGIKDGGAALTYGLGYDTDPQGTAQNRISARVTDSQGNVVYNVKDHEVGRDQNQLQTEIGLEAQRQVLAGIRAANLPKEMAKIFEGVDIASLDAAGIKRINDALQLVAQTQAAFKALAAVMPQFAGLTYDAQSKIVAFSGGIDKFGANLGSYYNHFYSASEKAANSTAQLNKAFADIGESTPKSAEAFRNLVQAQDLSTEAGEKHFAQLTALADAEKAYLDSMDEAAKSMGLGRDDIKKALLDSVHQGTSAADAGKRLADQVVGGVESAILDNTAGRIADIFVQGFVTPIVDAAITGASITDTVSKLAIADMVKRAEAVAAGMTALLNDPAYKEAMQKLREALMPIGSSLYSSAPPVFTPPPLNGGGSGDEQNKAKQYTDFIAQLNNTLGDLKAPDDYQRALLGINRSYKDGEAQLKEMGKENDAAGKALLNKIKDEQLAQLEQKQANTLRGYSITLLQAQGQTEAAQALQRQAELENIGKSAGKAAVEIQKQIYAQQDLATAVKQATDALTAGKNLLAAQGRTAEANTLGVGIAQQNYNAALSKAAGTFGFASVDGLQAWLRATNQTIEQAAQSYWTAMNESQRAAVTGALTAKAELISANRAVFDAQMQLVQQLGSELQGIRDLSSGLGSDIANAQIAAGKLDQGEYLDQQIAAAKTALMTLYNNGANIQEEIAGAQKLRELINQRYQAESQGTQKQLEAAKQIRAYLTGLDVSELGNGTVTDRMNAAAEQLQELAKAARGTGPDAEAAQGKITQLSDQYLQLARQRYGSGAGYNDALAWDKNLLGPLADKLGKADQGQTSALNKAVAELQNLKQATDYVGAAQSNKLEVANQKLAGVANQLQGMGVSLTTAINALPSAIANALRGFMSPTVVYSTGDGGTPAAKVPAFPKPIAVPAFDVGINDVPKDMVAMIHAGERIFPAADNRALFTALGERTDIAAVLAQLSAAFDKLRTAVEALRSDQRSGAVANVQATLDAADLVAETVEKATRAAASLQCRAAEAEARV